MADDSIDARVIGSRPGSSGNAHLISILSCPVDSKIYNMEHKYRGKCLILNHQVFDAHTGCSPRLGTDKDAIAIGKCFHNLDFDVTHLMDASYRDIHDLFVKVSKEDHTDNDCLAVIVLTHGDEESLWARDRKYPVDELFSHFNGLQCPTLVGKPKIFIIQACRGQKIDSGVRLLSLGEDVVDGSLPTYRIPSIADMLVYYSTAPGHYSFRNTELGSFFIQTLVSVLNQYCHQYVIDLLTLLTIVNQRVAVEFESYIPHNKQFHKKKQIPCIQSMLTRLVYFTPKPLPSLS